ncbi:TPA: SIR2 family protein [Enterobacter cloacae]
MKIKPQKHLINILTSTKNHHPNFTLFLGAGSSITSGVKSAGGMIQDWRDAYDDMHGEGEVRKQVWFDKDNEYSELFESLYDQPTQRREYIESCITAANPSWGYVYLVNLLKEKHFNTVFTTNFDDLLNEACYTFSDSLRPVVCAHDSSINSVRLTSSRPKIIKLHGDFLFDNIKNTIRELESLEDNMRSNFVSSQMNSV